MSSPARSSVSATSVGAAGVCTGGGSSIAGVDDGSNYHLPPELVSAHDRKEEALAALRSELMSSLNKEVKSLDDEAWMFAAPRSKINRLGKNGGYLQIQSERLQEARLPKETRHM